MATGSKIAQKVLARMRLRREQLGMSQAALAESIDVNPSYVGLLERGERVPSLDVLVELAVALDLELSELFSDAKAARNEMAELTRIRAILMRWPAKHREVAVRVLAEMDRVVRS